MHRSLHWGCLARRDDEAYSWILGGEATQPGAARGARCVNELLTQDTRILRTLHPSPRSGFTLTDLIIALATIAIVAAFAVPAFFNRSEVTLENAAVLLVKDLRAAQNRAAYLDRDIRVRFAEDGTKYWIDDGLPGEEDFLERDYSVDAVFRGVRVEEIAGAGEGLVFERRGTTPQGARITLTYEGDERIIVIEKDTGRMSIVGTTSGFADPGY